MVKETGDREEKRFIERKAILRVAGDKSVASQSRFYKTLLRKADERFAGT